MSKLVFAKDWESKMRKPRGSIPQVGMMFYESSCRPQDMSAPYFLELNDSGGADCKKSEPKGRICYNLDQ